MINNRATIISCGADIHIGRNCHIGLDFYVMDNNGHELEVGRRHLNDTNPRSVFIDDYVFIGSRVIIMKGAKIGRGSVISAGTVIPPNFEAPELSIIAGNPAAIVGKVKDATVP